MLDSLHIKNFRCFEDLTIPSLGRVNLIVGKNSSGKSTLLEAISIFLAGRNISSDADISIFLGGVRDLLSERNEFFMMKEPSDVQIFQKALKDESKLNFSMMEVRGKSKFELSIRRSKGQLIFYCINEAGTSLAYLQKNNSIYPHWEEPYTGQDSELDFIQNTNSTVEEDVPLAEIDELSILEPEPIYFLPIQHIPSSLIDQNLLAGRWDAIYNSNKDSEIHNLLKIIVPNISSIHFSKIKTSNDRIGLIKLIDENSPKPINALGEGVARLLQIAMLTLSTQKEGCILIDEFENGLHYSIQEEVWKKLFNLAEELDIQIFATTHSQDVIKAFSKAAITSPEKGCLIVLGRKPTKNNDGKIAAAVYGEQEIAIISKTGMEVR